MLFCPMVYWWEDLSLAFDSYVQPVPTPGLHEPPGLVLPFIEDSYSRSPGNSAVMVSREILLAAAELIGTAEEGIADDQFLWSFIGLRYPICVSPEPLSRYRQWAQSVCARGVAAGTHTSARARHLKWLTSYIETTYAGPCRDALISGCRAA
jgi:hypothetical protein